MKPDLEEGWEEGPAIFTIQEWAAIVASGACIPYDGSGYFGNLGGPDRSTDCFDRNTAGTHTHVWWYNK